MMFLIFIDVYFCRPSITSEISVLPIPSNSLAERDHFATPKETPGCKLCVQMDPNDPSKPLQVTHVPHLNHKDAQLADQAIKVSKFILSEVILQHVLNIFFRSSFNNLQVLSSNNYCYTLTMLLHVV